MKRQFCLSDLPDRVECGNVERPKRGRVIRLATRVLVGLSGLVWVFIWLM